MDAIQDHIDHENSEFWNELCGTIEAKRLGVNDSSKESLAKFDAWYLSYYPYLLPTIQPDRMRGKKVLEIGLGYGTVGQKLAEAGAAYKGMDIASKPVDHMNYRLRLHGLNGQALRGSALAIPFPDATFDFLVSIGCMHHTGNVQSCFDEAYRVLKPGGAAILMVYNKYAYQQWLSWPRVTAGEFWRGLRGHAKPAVMATEKQRAQFDSNTAGTAAPETVLLSIGQLKHMLGRFETVCCQKRNVNPHPVKGITVLPRKWLLATLGRLAGLDIYVVAQKSLLVGEENFRNAASAIASQNSNARFSQGALP